MEDVEKRWPGCCVASRNVWRTSKRGGQVVVSHRRWEPGIYMENVHVKC